MAAETTTHEDEGPTLEALLEQVTADDTAKRALTDNAFWIDLAEKIEAALAETPSIVETDSQRKAIASAAHKVARIKGTIDKTRLDLTRGLRDQVTAMNKRGGEITGHLEKVQVRVRKPLTEWEELEKAREAERKALTDRLNAAAVVTIDMTAEAIAGRLSEVESLTISDNLFHGAELEQLRQTRERVLDTLRNAHRQAQEREAKEAEYARLKAEEEERQRKAEEDARRRQAQADAARTAGEAPLIPAVSQTAPSAPQASPTAAGSLRPGADPDEPRNPVSETAGDFLRIADEAKFPLSPGLARRLAEAIREDRVRNVRWEG